MTLLKHLLLVATLGFSTQGFAALDYALEIGPRMQNGNTVNSAAELDSKMNFQVGLSGNLPIAEKWAFRTGLFYTQRNVVLKANNVESDVEFSSVDIPVTLLYRFEDYAGVFFGLNLVSNLDSSISNGTLQDVESLQTPLVLGASFKFAPQLGLSVYYEIGNSEVAQGLEKFRAIGANLLITFD